MPTEVVLELQAGFQDRLLQLGQKFRLERDGIALGKFTAIILRINPIDVPMELGADLREYSRLETRRDLVADFNIRYGDIFVQEQPQWATEVLTDPPRWKALKREDNPADFAVYYWLVKITENDNGFNA